MSSTKSTNPANTPIDYYGYLVYPDTGVITTKNGKILAIKNSEQVYLTINGKRKNIKRARVVWEATTGEKTKKGDIFTYKDKNPLNAAFSNITRYDRKFYFNAVDKKMKKYKVSPAKADEICKLFRSIMDDPDTKKSKSVVYTEISAKYGCSKSTIQKIIQGCYF